MEQYLEVSGGVWFVVSMMHEKVKVKSFGGKVKFSI